MLFVRKTVKKHFSLMVRVNTQNIRSVLREQKGILTEYRKDVARYDEGEKMKILFQLR